MFEFERTRRSSPLCLWRLHSLHPPPRSRCGAHATRASDYCAIAAISAISLVTSTSACRTSWLSLDAGICLRVPSVLVVPARTNWKSALPCWGDSASSEPDRFIESRTRWTRKSSCDRRRVMARRTGAMVGRIGATCSCSRDAWRGLASSVHDDRAGWCRRRFAPSLQEACSFAIRVAFVVASLMWGGCSSCTTRRGGLNIGIDRVVAVSSCAGAHVLHNDNAGDLGTSEAAAGGLRSCGVLAAVLREHPLHEYAITRGVQVDRDDSPRIFAEFCCSTIRLRHCCSTIAAATGQRGDGSAVSTPVPAQPGARTARSRAF